jgi:hypothetical protein
LKSGLPKDRNILIPVTCESYLSDLIKFRILKQRATLDYLDRPCVQTHLSYEWDRGRCGHTQKKPCKGRAGGDLKGLALTIRVMRPQAKEHRQPPETGRDKEPILLRTFRGHTPLAPGFCTLDPRTVRK